MKAKTLIATAVASAIAITPATAFAKGASSPAPAPTPKPTLAEVLLSDKAYDDANGFDRSWKDFDIVTQAVLAFPDLTAAALDPTASLTAFLPTDAAFKRLASALTGKQVRSEAKAFEAVAGLGLETVEEVLLLHVVPGATITAKKALKSNGAKLTTAQGEKLKVKVTKAHSSSPRVTIKDLSKTSSNARVI